MCVVRKGRPWHMPYMPLWFYWRPPPLHIPAEVQGKPKLFHFLMNLQPNSPQNIPLSFNCPKMNRTPQKSLIMNKNMQAQKIQVLKIFAELSVSGNRAFLFWVIDAQTLTQAWKCPCDQISVLKENPHQRQPQKLRLDIMLNQTQPKAEKLGRKTHKRLFWRRKDNKFLKRTRWGRKYSKEMFSYKIQK